MTRPRPDRVRVSGPLLSFAEGFRTQLVEQGYTPCSVQFQLQLLAHLSRWMEAGGVVVGEVSPAMVERFLAERRQQGYASRISVKGMRPLLGYLDGLGVLVAAAGVVPTPVDRLVGEFCRYLREERGLVAGSVELYARIARRFLLERSEPLADGLAGLSGREVNAFVLAEARRVRARTAETVVCALRALLRFLHVTAGSRCRWRRRCRRCRSDGRTCREGSRLGRWSCFWRPVTARRRSGAATSRS
jgi:integrase/recombinase XerD